MNLLYQSDKPLKIQKPVSSHELQCPPPFKQIFAWWLSMALKSTSVSSNNLLCKITNHFVYLFLFFFLLRPWYRRPSKLYYCCCYLFIVVYYNIINRMNFKTFIGIIKPSCRIFLNLKRFQKHHSTSYLPFLKRLKNRGHLFFGYFEIPFGHFAWKALKLTNFSNNF